MLITLRKKTHLKIELRNETHTGNMILLYYVICKFYDFHIIKYLMLLKKKLFRVVHSLL